MFHRHPSSQGSPWLVLTLRPPQRTPSVHSPRLGAAGGADPSSLQPPALPWAPRRSTSDPSPIHLSACLQTCLGRLHSAPTRPWRGRCVAWCWGPPQGLRGAWRSPPSPLVGRVFSRGPWRPEASRKDTPSCGAVPGGGGQNTGPGPGQPELGGGWGGREGAGGGALALDPVVRRGSWRVGAGGHRRTRVTAGRPRAASEREGPPRGTPQHPVGHRACGED